MTAPASRSRRTAAASAAEGPPGGRALPQPVTAPAMSKMSLMVDGQPAERSRIAALPSRVRGGGGTARAVHVHTHEGVQRGFLCVNAREHPFQQV